MRKGDGVSIIGFNCVQWVVSDIAAIMGGGVPVGIYTTSSPDQCYFLIKHSDSSIVDAEFIPISITLKYQELDAPG